MIEFKNVTKRYGKKVALDDVTMTFKKGEISCLLGLNGVGKSTAMKAIMKMIPINKGEILLEGSPITSNDMNRFAYVPDLPIHDLSLTAPQNFAIAAQLYPLFDVKKAERLATFLKLPMDKKLRDLSKGNLARFNIIVGLSQRADYVLLDESFSGIDIFTREIFIEGFKDKFLEEGQTVILTTHEIDEIQDIADTVILLEEGEVFHTFTKAEATAEGLSIIDKMRTLYRPEMGGETDEA